MTSPHYEPPRRRTYTERTGKGRDVDQAERMRLVYIALWSPAGAVLGLLLGVRGSVSYGWGPGMIVATTLVGWACAFFGPILILRMGGAAITSIYMPKGSRVPHKKEYSQAESLVARGMYREAVAAFESAALENPSDPTPYLRVARVYRDQLQEYEHAGRWFRRARREASMADGQAGLVTRELVELYTHHMGEPRKALPELARLAEEKAGTDEGEWAARELQAIKADMVRERNADGGPDRSRRGDA